MTVKARVALTFLVPAALGIALAGIAWACTPPDLRANPDWIAAPGQEVTVTGEYFGNATVELAIAPAGNPAGAHYLGTAQGPTFSQSVMIPADLANGNYYITAGWTSTNEKGEQVADSTAAAFRIGEVEDKKPTGDKSGNTVKTPGTSPNAGGGGSTIKSKSGLGAAGAVEAASSAVAAQPTPGASPAATVVIRGESRQRDDGAEDAVRAPWSRLSDPAAASAGAGLFAVGDAPSFSDVDALTADESASPNYLTYGAALLSLSLIALLAAAGVVAVRARRSAGGGGPDA